VTDGIRVETLRELLWNLIEIYSPSGKEESVLEYLQEFFAREGCPYGIQPVDENRYNLVLGWGDSPLVLVGHVDTVDAWDLDNMGPEDLGNGWVRGVGAADMKGGLVAAAIAFATPARLRRDLDSGRLHPPKEATNRAGSRSELRDELRRLVVGDPASTLYGLDHLVHLCGFARFFC